MTDNVNGWRQQRPTEKENFTPVKTSVRRHERPTDIAKLSDFKSSQLGTNLKSKCETFEKFGNLADKPVNRETIDKKCSENDNNIELIKSVRIVSKTSKETNLPQRHLYSANVNNNVNHIKGDSPGKTILSSRIYGLIKKVKSPIKSSSNKKKSITKYIRLSSETHELRPQNDTVDSKLRVRKKWTGSIQVIDSF